MIDTLETAQLRKLREECKTHPPINNFEQLCRIGITFIAMLIDETVAEKAKAPQDRGS